MDCPECDAIVYSETKGMATGMKVGGNVVGAAAVIAAIGVTGPIGVLALGITGYIGGAAAGGTVAHKLQSRKRSYRCPKCDHTFEG